jgi:hypothetical protein
MRKLQRGSEASGQPADLSLGTVHNLALELQMFAHQRGLPQERQLLLSASKSGGISWLLPKLGSSFKTR